MTRLIGDALFVLGLAAWLAGLAYLLADQISLASLFHLAALVLIIGADRIEDFRR